MSAIQSLDVSDYLSSKEKTTLDALKISSNILIKKTAEEEDFLNIPIGKLLTTWSSKMQDIITDLASLFSKLKKFEKYFSDVDNTQNWWIGLRKFLSEFISLFTKDNRAIYTGITLIIISLMLFSIKLTS